MFSNFIYFIAAILLYGAYTQGYPAAGNPDKGTLLAVFPVICIFFVLEHFYFKNLSKKISGIDPEKADLIFTKASGFFAVSALIIYAAMVYIADISEYLPVIIKNSRIGTLKDILIVSLFTALISGHWCVSYQAYRKIYSDNEGLPKYLKSQLMFSIPVIVPWIFLSVLSDLVELLPFNEFRTWLYSPEGDLVFFVTVLLSMSFAGPFLIRIAWGCRPLSDAAAIDVIKKICDRTGIGFREILEWPLKGGNAITAGVMGVFSRFRFLLVTPALLANMTPDELGAVISHEAGHVKYRHMMLYLVIIGSFSFTTMTVSTSFEEIAVFSGFLAIAADTSGMTGRSLSFIPGLFSVVFFIAFIRFIFGYFMRNFERQADAYSFKIMESAAPLARAFYRIVLLTRQDPEKPSWHHYSIRERINFILYCEADHKRIIKHDRKVILSLSAYFICLLTMIFSAGFYEKSELRDSLLKNFLIESIQKRSIETGTANHSHHGKRIAENMEHLVADYYYIKGSIEKSATFYEKALQDNPDDPEILNSLAWLYATADKKKIRNPVKALELSRKAVMIKPSSVHIWDTLAESCYSAGDYGNAVLYGKKTIGMAEEKDRDYYEKQLAKFMKKAADNYPADF